AAHTFTQFEDKPAFTEVNQIAERYIADYIAGRIDRVDVAYMKFINAARQAPVVETLLPLSAVPGASEPDAKAPTKAPGKAPAKVGPAIKYEFLPSEKDILQKILPMSFKIRLFKAFLDAAVSEQIARKVAMAAATENAGEMIKSLTRQYNRARQ